MIARLPKYFFASALLLLCSALALWWRAPLTALAVVAAAGLLVLVALPKISRFCTSGVWQRLRWGWPLFLLLAIFYFSPYTKISTSAGPAEKSFSIHYHFAGVLSIWEALLLLSLLLVIFRQVASGRWQLVLGPWFGVPLLFAGLVLAFAIGIMHSNAGALAYGITGVKRPLIAFTLPVYMFVTYLLVTNLVQRRHQLLQTLRWLDFLTVGLVIYGFVSLGLILTGRVQGMWYFGLPVVLYDQMVMLYVPIFAIGMLYLSGKHIGVGRTILLLTMLFFILTSTRRMNYLLLGLGILLMLLIGLHLRIWQPFRLVSGLTKIAGSVLLSTLLLLMFLPRFVDGVKTSIQTLNVWSALGQKYSGDLRLAEFDNLFANLHERPYTYLTGFGLGTMWQAIGNQPVDPLTKKLRLKRNWYTMFHLPYLAMLYRLGFGGAVLFGLWLFGYGRYLLGIVRRARQPLRPLLLAMLVFLLLILPAILDSLNPTAWTLCGLYAALLEKMALVRT